MSLHHTALRKKNILDLEFAGFRIHGNDVVESQDIVAGGYDYLLRIFRLDDGIKVAGRVSVRNVLAAAACH